MAGAKTRVKICGICDPESALCSVEAGADALGFVFTESKRRITPGRARDIIRLLPPFVSKVGVFVDQSLEEVSEIADYTGLDTVQLHGCESPEFCKALKLKVIKAVSVGASVDEELLKKYEVDAYLLDTLVPGTKGGTGKTFDWTLAGGVRWRPVILAGGLTPDNVLEAIRIARPYAVDVSSGVETNGKKDFAKIKEFVRRVKG
ncbi:MAG: phosphoribosylanthranilate isomerase [Bacillota bacterium]